MSRSHRGLHRAGELPAPAFRVRHQRLADHAHICEGSGPMTARDRLVVIVLGAVAVLAGAWLLAVSPERKQANELATQVSAASSKLAAAESQVANARAAQANYAAAYAAVVKLGKAVP